MKIYTKTGDAGDTGLFGGQRVSKSDARVAAYGDVDETNACLGLARAQVVERLTGMLQAIQADLFVLGAELAAVPEQRARLGLTLIGAPDVERLEFWIDELEADLPPLRAFVLPGGCVSAATLHLARTVCRRAERAVVGALEAIRPSLEARIYLNRLSDLLFVMARYENHSRGVAENVWSGRG